MEEEGLEKKSLMERAVEMQMWLEDLDETEASLANVGGDYTRCETILEDLVNAVKEYYEIRDQQSNPAVARERVRRRNKINSRQNEGLEPEYVEVHSISGLDYEHRVGRAMTAIWEFIGGVKAEERQFDGAHLKELESKYKELEESIRKKGLVFEHGPGGGGRGW